MRSCNGGGGDGRGKGKGRVWSIDIDTRRHRSMEEQAHIKKGKKNDLLFLFVCYFFFFQWFNIKWCRVGTFDLSLS